MITDVADSLGVSGKTPWSIVNGRQGISPEVALRLATAFANTTAEFWLKTQENYDLALARKKVDTSNVRVFWSKMSSNVG